VHYTLTTLENTALPTVSRLVLVSPAIGVTPVAALAVWQARLGHLLGLEKLAWDAVLPEYDPFKYGSFAVNAGDLEYRLTHEIQNRLKKLSGSTELTRFPPVLAFQSAVDATVSAPALVESFFARLPAGGHELVLFDINRTADIMAVLRKDARVGIETLLNDPNLTFAISLVSNADESSERIVVRHKPAGGNATRETDAGLSWPPDLYSLTHVALPFPADDPLYGDGRADASPGIQLGRLALRGERSVLQITAADMLRLRWNPFYPYLERRLLDFLGLDTAEAGKDSN
jgi:alpha-beta hydrolase superfamily lysophospholipase